MTKNEMKRINKFFVSEAEYYCWLDYKKILKPITIKIVGTSPLILHRFNPKKYNMNKCFYKFDGCINYEKED